MRVFGLIWSIPGEFEARELLSLNCWKKRANVKRRWNPAFRATQELVDVGGYLFVTENLRVGGLIPSLATASNKELARD